MLKLDRTFKDFITARLTEYCRSESKLSLSIKHESSQLEKRISVLGEKLRERLNDYGNQLLNDFLDVFTNIVGTHSDDCYKLGFRDGILLNIQALVDVRNTLGTISSDETNELNKKIDSLKGIIENLLDSEDKKIFSELQQLENQSITLEQEMDYKYGFRDGAIFARMINLNIEEQPESNCVECSVISLIHKKMRKEETNSFEKKDNKY